MLPFILIPLIWGGATLGMTIDGLGKLAKAKRRKEEGDASLAAAQEEFSALVKRLIELTQRHESWVVRQVHDRLKALQSAVRVSAQAGRVDSMCFGQDEALSAQGVNNEVLADAAKGALGGLATGMAAQAAVTSLVAEFGVASTGTAIASLSGAAASSATTAAIGGGSLAAGGGGMALGGAILGGVVAAPVLLGLGMTILLSGEKAETQAEEYFAKVSKAVAQIRANGGILDRAVRSRVEELERIFQLQIDAFDKLVADLRNHPQAGGARMRQRELSDALVAMIQSSVVLRIRTEKKEKRLVEDVQIEAVLASDVSKAVRKLSQYGRKGA